MCLLRNELKLVTNLKVPIACMGDIKIANIESSVVCWIENQRTG